MLRSFRFGLVTTIFLMGALANADPYRIDQAHVPSQLIVKYRPGILQKFVSRYFDLGGSVEEVFKDNSFLLQLVEGTSDLELLELAKQFDQDDTVEFVEANSYVYAIDVAPNDPRVSEQWGLNRIKANKAWEMGTGDKDTLVSIIDSGVDYRHSDLAKNYWKNSGETGLDENGNDKSTNGIDDDKNGYIDDWRGWNFVDDNNRPMDDNGHGTHIAGVIAAEGDNTVGVTGINWSGSIVGLKFLDAKGSGTVANAIKAIDYSISIGSFLTNNSWGGRGFSQSLYEAVKRANQAGQLFIAAAGNSGKDNTIRGHYPSNFDLPNLIAVAASDQIDKRAIFSNYGRKNVHIAAPGIDILSTLPGERYGLSSGTSMAAPFVSGAAALLKGIYKNKSAFEVKKRILSSSEPIKAFENLISTGGILNLENAVEDDLIPPEVVKNIVISDELLDSFKVSFDPSGDDGDLGVASAYELRSSIKSIDNETDWALAEVLPLQLDAPTGLYVVNGLKLGRSGYIAIRAKDNVGNWSPISDSHKYSLKEYEIIRSFDGSNLDDIVFQAPWTPHSYVDEEIKRFVLTTSKGGSYANDTDAFIQFPQLEITDSHLFINLTLSHDLENHFDFLYLESSVDRGETWTQIAEYTGRSLGYMTDLHPLFQWSSLEDRQDTLLVRLRFKSDYSVTKGGVLIDQVNFVN